ncbi:hypothetical protein ACFO0N_11405 [Halobium salinum]|uniref:Uncharacterized protein n=1 Tax=Halobium salinum TaxID=1364940 RepID=A0ABD5PCD1_9EURY|nr:hypothetical protein [Halobium salinum]
MVTRMGGLSTGRSGERVDVTEVPAAEVEAYATTGADLTESADFFLERRGARTYLVTRTERASSSA